MREGPDRLGLEAQDRTLARGGKLSAEEEAKRRKSALDLWDEIEATTEGGKFPKGTDVFLYKFHGLFYVAPAQDAFMCRLRLPGGLLAAHQLEGIAAIAQELAGGYAHVTTRANIQLREIRPRSAASVVARLEELGIVTRGAGADNIRNVTSSPTAGIDPDELWDTRPLARQMHQFILRRREMYGLPRKFNIAFDGGGAVSALGDTNDIGFAAVRVGEGGAGGESGVEPGVYFRMELGGITGHGDFARDTGVLLAPDECVPVAAALVRVFIAEGDRTDRKRARFKYVLDRLGIERCVEEAEKVLGRKLRRLPLEACERPRAPDPQGHIGFHPQRQEGLVYCGVVLPVGRLSPEAMRGLARIAAERGSGSLRLTVWQNVIIPDVPAAEAEAVERELLALGLDWRASSFRAGLVACTGSFGCKYAAADTKRHALEIAQHLEARLELDRPLNIHLTGCPHSCAQHAIGDIGLLGTKVERGEDLVEGYRIFVGGGHGPDREIGREVPPAVAAEDASARLEAMVRAYLAHRSSAAESFHEFARRHSLAELERLFVPTDHRSGATP